MDLMNYKPEKPFAQRHLLTHQDWSADENLQTLSLPLQLKAKQKPGEQLSVAPLPGEKHGLPLPLK